MIVADVGVALALLAGVLGLWWVRRRRRGRTPAPRVPPEREAYWHARLLEVMDEADIARGVDGLRVRSPRASREVLLRRLFAEHRSARRR